MPVEYRKLGSSGLRVSVPILGCMSFGSSEWQPWVLEKDTALPILKKAYDLGITTWDTANGYSNGDSERIIAAAIKKYNMPRDELIIMTKCFFPYDKKSKNGLKGDVANKRQFVNQHGLSRAAIFNQVNDSLVRLGTDYIDVLQIHRYDKNVEPEEVMGALNDLVRSGKVRYIGASSMCCYEFAMLQHVAEKNRWAKFVSMQDHYNLLYREEEREMIPYCNLTGVGLIPWSPLAAGYLARTIAATSIRKTGMHSLDYQVTDRATMEIINRVEKVAMEKAWLMSDVALAWILTKVSSPIVGVNSIERLEQVAGANGKSLTLKEIKFLEEPYEPRRIMD
ncbi:NADP-dependent oxidoreductase domain-containing protein [Lipomyces tetrasporus]|uniref:NADP-dependent oxidoreductase domain-containing protein n=1 Tax=Lipomyces tetrasporus TaxID=54092 RepID=A0AAD7QWT2_9ASCO|nr:NADP-dependent oxidoreductase domain-containing protein [Lipomyces tetrasporus]KAJ8102972.1 NADP-dependent oxidoreductase domain-containing protein [Lipomyces tetrasporus]